MSVEIELTSKRYHCHIKLNEKVTFICGDSGVGKTEFTRRLQSRTSANKVNVSNGFEIIILTEERFMDMYRIAKRHINNLADNTGTLKEYWSNSNNFPYFDSIIVIDDEDFIKKEEFSQFYNADKYNYYILIHRGHISNIGYSVNEVYDFRTSGKEHWLERRYKSDDFKADKIDIVLTEGTGSDYFFFKELFIRLKVLHTGYNSETSGGGRFEAVKVIERNRTEFEYQSLYPAVDFCAFGANFEAFIEICKVLHMNLYIDFSYLSFEYMLLRSNLIKDENLEEFVEENKLKYISLESLFTERLKSITKETLYSYSKSSQNFSVCYWMDCCANKKYQSNLSCRWINKWRGKNKFVELLKNTIFEYFLNWSRQIE